MRNPLNSIIAQNLEKTKLYEELEKILSLQGDPAVKEKTTLIMEQLKKGKKVQESSCKIMMYLVQDFLDYAQIKAGKFRKNVTTFNICEAVEEIMSIQRKKAEISGLELCARYVNISHNDQELHYSPIISSDEQRIMQILLNL